MHNRIKDLFKVTPAPPYEFAEFQLVGPADEDGELPDPGASETIWLPATACVEGELDATACVEGELEDNPHWVHAHIVELYLPEYETAILYHVSKISHN